MRSVQKPTRNVYMVLRNTACRNNQHCKPTSHSTSDHAPVYAQALQAGDAGCSERLDSLGAMGSGLYSAPLLTSKRSGAAHHAAASTKP